MSIVAKLLVTSLVFIDMLEEFMRREPKNKLLRVLQCAPSNREGMEYVRMEDDVELYRLSKETNRA